MGEKCLYCHKPLKDGEKDFHSHCARKFFGRSEAPILPYSRDNIDKLALKVIESSMTLTGVQPKLSLDINKGDHHQPDKLTIVGLWGRYILKPQSDKYISMPELEDVTMNMAAAAGIETAEHSLIRMCDGEIAYITKRMDRDSDGGKFSMLDMCQLTNRLSEHKYMGSYIQLARTIRSFSAANMLDVQRFWSIVVFSWITGNSDMHCKNFSLIKTDNTIGYHLSPAYDLLSVLLTGIEDPDELAMPLTDGKNEQDGFIGGYDRMKFIEAITESGIGERYAAIIIDRLKQCRDKWFSLIDESLLSDTLKSRYKALINMRLEKL